MRFPIWIIWSLAISIDATHEKGDKSREATQYLQDQPSSHPAASDLLGDFDHDGIVGKEEVSEMRLKLHRLFDLDENGNMDRQEVRSVVDGDVESVYHNLDTNVDNKISYRELDNRWEQLGAELTVSEVADWLRYAVQLPQYAPIFVQHVISGYSFPLLIENNGQRLAEIGISSELHRQQLILVIKRKIAGAGKLPSPVTNITISSAHEDQVMTGSHLVLISWTSERKEALRFQLQRRLHSQETWKTVYSGTETHHMDLLESESIALYRVCSWNSVGRSERSLVKWTAPPPIPEQHGIWRYVEWLDEIGLVLLLLFLPYRLYLNGRIDFIRRFFRRLPPNPPTRLSVEYADVKQNLKPGVSVSWTPAKDNQVPVVAYIVECVAANQASAEKKVIEVTEKPLVSRIIVSRLRHGETYKFTVTARNEYGLHAESGLCMYMLPPKSPSHSRRNASETRIKKVIENRDLLKKCYLCADPNFKGRYSVLSVWNRKILHYCRLCERKFCHDHRGYVDHSRGLSCPAIDGHCTCVICYADKIKKTKTK